MSRYRTFHFECDCGAELEFDYHIINFGEEPEYEVENRTIRCDECELAYTPHELEEWYEDELHNAIDEAQEEIENGEADEHWDREFQRSREDEED